MYRLLTFLIMIKKTIFACIIISLSGCTNKKCKEAEDTARAKSKDTNLMYLWRYTDDLIRESIGRDSGFVSFKPNGEYNAEESIKYINIGPDIWYSNNNLILKNYCLDQVPNDLTIYKYLIKNDTLYLYGSTNSNNDFANIPKTYVHHKKY